MNEDYRKVASSRLVFYSILDSLGKRSQYISIKFRLHKQSQNPWMCHLPRNSSVKHGSKAESLEEGPIFINSPTFLVCCPLLYGVRKSSIFTQSICTPYSCFENQGRFVTLKKNWAPCFFQKAGCKKPRSLLFKKRRGSLVSSLLDYNFKRHVISRKNMVPDLKKIGLMQPFLMFQTLKKNQI